jgi:mono/diheme cytochrome c family protein
VKRIVALAAAALVAACAAPRHSEPLSGPFRPANDLEARGQVVYQVHCLKCHEDGRASLGPPLLPVPDFMIRLQVRVGMGAMPAFGEDRISSRDLDSLIAYLDAIRGRDLRD